MKAAKTVQPEVTAEAYRETIEFMDGLSQEGFSHIAAIARLALLGLETPEGHRSVATIARAFEVILGKAEDIENSINVEAEKVGCNHVDDTMRRRYDARREVLAVRQQGAAA